MPFIRYSFIITSFVLFCVVMSCKSSKTISSSEGNLNLSAKQLIKANTNQEATFKTLSARVKLEIFQGEKTEKYTVNLRME